MHARTPGSRSGCMETSSPETGAVPLALAARRRSVDHLESTGPAGVSAIGASDVAAVLLPVAALYLDRPMPPARALVDAGAIVALATDFNPGSALREPPRRRDAGVHELGSRRGGPRGHDRERRDVLGLPDRGRIAVGLRADIVLLDAPDWRHVAYHLAGEVVHTVIREGQVVASRA